MKRTEIKTEEELNRHVDAIIQLNEQINSSVFTDVTLLQFAFKDALKKEQSPFIIAIYVDQFNLQALIPLYCFRRKELKLLWDKTSDYVDILSLDSALGYVKAEFDRLLKNGYSFCLNKIREDAKVLKVLKDFNAPLQKSSREKLENAWAISKLNELPKLNAGDIKRRRSQLEKRGVRVEYVDKHAFDRKIRESILEIVYLKCVEFASRNKPYHISLELDVFTELIFSLVKEGKAFIAKAVNPNSLIDAAILFFKDSTSIYSMMPTYNLHAPHSPGLSLMYHTIEDFLTSKNGLVVYDFTLGDEGYKKRLSNQQVRIYSIFLSNRISKRIYNYLAYRILDNVKSSTGANRFKLLLTDKLISAQFISRKFISKVKDYSSIGFFPAVKTYVTNRTCAVLLFKREGEPDQDINCDRKQYKFSTASFPDLIKFYSKNISDRYEALSKIDTSIHRMVKKYVPYGLFLDEDLVSVAWLQCSGKYTVSEKGYSFDLKEDECAIQDVMTDSDHRRKGLYSLLQYKMLATDELKNKKVILHVTSTNIPSIKVHQKLGYFEFKSIR